MQAMVKTEVNCAAWENYIPQRKLQEESSLEQVR